MYTVYTKFHRFVLNFLICCSYQAVNNELNAINFSNLYGAAHNFLRVLTQCIYTVNLNSIKISRIILLYAFRLSIFWYMYFVKISTKIA